MSSALALPPAELRRVLEAELEYRMLELYRPYAKQREFHAAGAECRERAFMAGNQLGKTRSGGMEVAMHLTGLYPDWWPGRRFDGATVCWAASNTGEATRDTVERVLMGRVSARGTGTIPADRIIDTTASRGTPDALAAVTVRHVSGKVSLVLFKAYEQGRTKWQGDSIHVLWCDEEPPEDIYDEGLTRTNATKGIALLTATPLLGMTEVVRRFYPRPSTPDRHLTMMTIEDVEHYTQAERAKIIAAYPEHEREARAKGIPTLGSGRVFPVADSAVAEPPVQIPRHWPRICGLDFGWDHPTAAAWMAWDRDADVVHIYDAYRVREGNTAVHAAALNGRGKWVPVAWPHDGLQHDKASGETLAAHYRKHGANLLGEHAQHADGGIGVEAGLLDMLERMQTGRLKVAEHLADWFEEFRMYHRKDGRIVKERDDLMSATRYGIMCLRFARLQPDESLRMPRQAAAWDVYA